MPLKFRFTRESDLSAVRLILGEEFAGNSWEVRKWMEGIEANLPMMFSLLRDDELVGFSGIQFVGQREIIFHSDCVRKSEQRRGLGTLLCKARIAFLDEEAAPYAGGLLALEKNIGFYEKMGFSLLEPPQFDPVLKYSFASMEMEIDRTAIGNAHEHVARSGVIFAIDEEDPAIT